MASPPPVPSLVGSIGRVGSLLDVYVNVNFNVNGTPETPTLGKTQSDPSSWPIGSTGAVRWLWRIDTGPGVTCPMTAALTRGRRALADHSWRDAATELTTADAQQPLDCADLEQLALARFLTGEDDASLDAWTRCYQRHVSADEHAAAARCAFWAGFQAQLAGEMAHASGWLTRATQALDKCPGGCVERGYVLIPHAIGFAEAGDATQAGPLFTEALTIGTAFHDATLIALGNLGLAHVHLLTGEIERGLTRLDEVMVSITVRRGEAQRHRDHLLRHDHRLPGSVRRAPRSRVDARPQQVVREAARPRAIPWAVPRAPGGADAAEGSVARRTERGGTGTAEAFRATEATGAGHGVLRGRRAASPTR